jgi:hypothetical protein
MRLQVRFVTNTAKDTTSNLVRLVQGMGFDIQEHEVQAAAVMSLKHGIHIAHVSKLMA